MDTAVERIPRRRPVAAVVGNARADPLTDAAASELGRMLVDSGFRVLTGGMFGVMEAASRGARAASAYVPGDTVGVLPTYRASDANPYVDVCICTGMNHARNVVVAASADVVMVVGGRTGTLSEIALAWRLGKPIIVVDVGRRGEPVPDGSVADWGDRLAGLRLDDRRDGAVLGPFAPQAAVERAVAELSLAGSTDATDGVQSAFGPGSDEW